MQLPRTYYIEKLKKLEQERSQLKKIIRWLVLSRLLIFLAIFPCIFYLMPTILWPGIILTVISVIVFLILVKIHLQQTNRQKHLEALIHICKQEIEALQYAYEMFPSGEEYMDISHPYSYDMDLFGPGSLFQFLNRTVTITGSHKLAKMLSHGRLEPDRIIKIQDAVKELGGMPELILDFRAAGSLNSDTDSDLKIIESWLSEPVYYLSRKFLRWLANILPILTITLVCAAPWITFFRGIAISLFLIQLLIVGMRLTHTSIEHEKLGKRLNVLRKYQELLRIMERGKYAAGDLTAINNILNSNTVSASASIHSLVKILSAFDNRLNILAAIFLEGFLLWDLQCMIRLEKWKKVQGKYFKSWIDALASFDSMVSLSTFAFNHPKLSYPKFSGKVFLQARQLGHILIPDNERVCNDFKIEKKGDFIVVTGANMAGKSTFLRTLATNIILAMAGAPVCAEEFIFRPVSIFSSMRTSDSLNKHESYFYAELLRLKGMLDWLKTGESLFIILDEILKGTNSADKQKGSYAVLRQILDMQGTGILATHDLHLASIENDYPGRVKNMCFEIEIDQASISFDYILRDGVTTKMNAMLLMKQMGIITG